LDPLENKIEGQFKMCSGKGMDDSCTVNIESFDILPVYGDYKAYVLMSFAKSKQFQVLDDFPLAINTMSRPVSFICQFNGVILRLYTSQKEWDSLTPDQRESMLEREESFYYSARTPNAKGQRCIFSQALVFLVAEKFNEASYQIAQNSDSCDLLASALKIAKQDQNVGIKQLLSILGNTQPRFRDIRVMKCGVGEESLILGVDEGCCHKEVSQLVNMICIGADEDTKATLCNLVSKECLSPPGMTEEELTFRILSLFNNEIKV
jgi:hypothetical protein